MKNTTKIILIFLAAIYFLGTTSVYIYLCYSDILGLDAVMDAEFHGVFVIFDIAIYIALFAAHFVCGMILYELRRNHG